MIGNSPIVNPNFIRFNDTEAELNSMLRFEPVTICDRLMSLFGNDIDRDIAGDIAFDTVSIDYLYDMITIDYTRDIAGDIVGDIVRGIDNDITEVPLNILAYCLELRNRQEIMMHLGLVKNVKNFNNYIAPLIKLKWMAMTIPDKPTTPHQRYRTTLKGAALYKLFQSSKKFHK